MKKIILVLFSLVFSFAVYAQAEPSNLGDKGKKPSTEAVPEETEPVAEETESVTEETETLTEETETVTEEPAEAEETADVAETEEPAEAAEPAETAKEPEKSKASKAGISKVPAAKRPKPIDKEKAEKAAEKDESEEDAENNRKTIQYGLPSEISELIDKLTKNEDPRFSEEIYDVFQVTKSTAIKEKVLKYFTKQEDPCLEDFAVDLLNDPYDEKNDIVKASFQYISAVKTKEAIPAVLSLIESENENYFNDAIAAIGEIGGPSEAVFLVEYLDRDDLSDAQRQILMRTCGKMHAVETWERLVEILEDEDENTYVRMYAAEAIGLMEKKESVPVLVEAFTATDPNLRQYVIKGLVNFPKVVEARETILQAIRDEYWRVRQEAIKAVKELELEDASPFLIYRIKNDSEKVIKEEAIKTLAFLNTDDGNEFLVSQVTDKKVGDASKKKIIEVLLKEGHAGEKEILELADTCVTDDKRKDLRYAIGKELAKYENSHFEDICLKYLESKDTTTISLGIDIYKSNKFHSAEAKMRSLYDEKKTNSSVKSRIKKMLNIKDEDE